MGYHLKLVNLDQSFNRTTRPPIIVNTFPTHTKEGREDLNRLLYIRYQGDTLDVVPSCECGKLTGAYNEGILCDTCQTTPTSITERPLESSLWMEPPDGVEGFVNPTAWIILHKALYDNGQRMLEWMCSPTYTIGGEPKHRMRKLIDMYQERGFQRGLNFFIRNFDLVFGALVEHRLLYNNKRIATEALILFVRRYRDALFPRHLPLPSRLSFITEDTVTGRYADTTMTAALDAALTISEISHSAFKLSPKVKEARTVKTIMLLAAFYENMVGKTFGQKPGWFRKHFFGSRLHQSARGVITSISDNHLSDECYMPWSMAVMLFKAHLQAKLMKRDHTPGLKYTVNECVRFIFENTLKYNPLMHELFDELLAEAFGDPFGIPILLNRNPSLQRGSIQLLRVTRIKTDVSDNSISLGVLVLNGFNADFDGDALNLIVVPDKEKYERCKALSPYLTTLDLREPWTMSSNLKMPAPVTTNIANWMHHAR